MHGSSLSAMRLNRIHKTLTGFIIMVGRMMDRSDRTCCPPLMTNRCIGFHIAYGLVCYHSDGGNLFAIQYNTVMGARITKGQ